MKSQNLRCHSGGMYKIHIFEHDQVHMCDLEIHLNAWICALQLTPFFSRCPLKRAHRAGHRFTLIFIEPFFHFLHFSSFLHFSTFFLFFIFYMFFHLLFLFFFYLLKSREDPVVKGRFSFYENLILGPWWTGEGWLGVAHLRVTSLSCFFFSRKFHCWHLVVGLNGRCLLRGRSSMEMWCPDDTGWNSWDWVGPPPWESMIQLSRVWWRLLAC